MLSFENCIDIYSFEYCVVLVYCFSNVIILGSGVMCVGGS